MMEQRTEDLQLGDWEACAAGLLQRGGRHRVLRRIDEDRICTTVRYARRSLSERGRIRLVLIDTEATGLDPDRDEVVEIAARPVTVIEPAAPGDAYSISLASLHRSTFVGRREPGVPMTEGAARVTGIGTEDLAGKTIDEEALRRTFDGAELVVAHNARFDRAMCVKHWPWLADLDWACSDRDIDWRRFGAHSNNLQALANWQGFYFEGAHGAAADVQALLHTLSVPFETGEPATVVAGRFAATPATTGFAELIRTWRAGTVRVFAWGSPYDTKDRLRLRGYRWDAGARVWARDMPGMGSEPIDDEQLSEELKAEVEWLKTECWVDDPEIRRLSNQERWA